MNPVKSERGQLSTLYTANNTIISHTLPEVLFFKLLHHVGSLSLFLQTAARLVSAAVHLFEPHSDKYCAKKRISMN